ncbi:MULTISPECIES: DUF3047 domain-containing protein [Ramlibacter]|uniref:DUF3047 domain-containing protein n=1 Tax=Ramlibacter pinisoli TaxID=2682844 RepID=A0A6N8IU03_9BURK|nr:MULTISPECIES: DUF3047 domain-containing protein [Ramlibacter]MVQ30337.1 DUF3047 domain-containing protein [Ramlibacter pinisoli]
MRLPACLSPSLTLSLLVALCGPLSGCMTTPAEPAPIGASAWAQASRLPAGTGTEGWLHQSFPGKRDVQFESVRQDGRDTLAATADAAASTVRHKVRIEPAELGSLRFSWKVPELIAEADLATRDADDSPVRVMLAFDGDRSRLSAKDAMLSELMRTLTGEEMPYATLMYVWCNQRAPGTVIRSPRTERIRKLVLESGPNKLNRWLEYERDIRADYERAFGEPPGALIGVAIMTDSDNTRSLAKAWYGPVRFGALAATP